MSEIEEEGYREVNHQWSVEITSPTPVRLIRLETSLDRAFAAGRIAGLREAAEVLIKRGEGYQERADMPGIDQGLRDERAYGAEVCEHAAAAILALAGDATGKEG